MWPLMKTMFTACGPIIVWPSVIAMLGYKRLKIQYSKQSYMVDKRTEEERPGRKLGESQDQTDSDILQDMAFVYVI